MEDNLLELFREWKNILPRNLYEGLVGRCDELIFEIHYRENERHKIPHLHVRTSSASLVLNIQNGEIITYSGKIGPNNIRKAKEWVKNNQDMLIKKWNEIPSVIKIK